MPTTPRTELEIEITFGDESAGDARALPAASLREEWGRFFAFLKRPSLIGDHGRGAPITVLARIYALDMLIMLALIAAASAAVGLGVDLPKTAISDMDITLELVMLVVLVAPVSEELIFRSWLSGKPGHIIALLAAGAGIAGLVAAESTAPLAGIAVALIGLSAAFAALIGLRGRPPIDWFAGRFPFFFWLSTIAFGMIHLANFDEGSAAILLPLVLPQLVLGSMLGYLRVRIGLWASIALHAVHNATAIGLAVLASGGPFGG